MLSNLRDADPQNGTYIAIAVPDDGNTLYIYTTLAEMDTIRLVRILPGEDDSAVQLELIHAELTDTLEYEALSYPWLDWPTPEETLSTSMDSEDVFINGQKVVASHTLATYLRMARQLEERRGWLWVDALCINQQDLEERNAQVLKMKKIYPMAQRVVVWLGRAVSIETNDGPPIDSKVGIDFLNEIYDHCPSEHGQLLAWFEKILRETEDVLSWAKWKSLLTLLRKPWWSRMWVVQEARDVIMYCGDSVLSWDQLDYVVVCISTAFGTIQRHFQNANIDPSDLISNTSRFMNLRKVWHSSHPFNAAAILHRIGSNLCADPRDKIYGIVGIIPNGEAMVPLADYSLNAEDVYKNAFSALASTGDLDVLTLVNEERHVNLPSWCPHLLSERFRMRRLHTLLNHPAEKQPQFAAGGSKEASCLISDDRMDITVRGLHLGTLVPRLAPDPDKGLLTRYATQEDTWEAIWRSTVGDICRLVDADNSYRAPASFGDVFALDCIDAQEDIRTQEVESTFVSVPNAQEVPTSTIKDPRKTVYGRPVASFNEWYRTLTDPTSQTFLPPEILETWARQHLLKRGIYKAEFPPETASAHYEFRHTSFPRTMAGRRLLLTNSGYIGLGLDTARNGDIVAVIYGCNMPMVLRPEEGYYVVVGECYVHGAMFGEALEEQEHNWHETEFKLR